MCSQDTTSFELRMLPSLLQWAPLVHSVQDRLFTSEGFHSIANIHCKKKVWSLNVGKAAVAT